MKRGINLRGQVSAFFIIGVVIAVSLGIFSYNLKVKNDSRLNNEFFNSEEMKPQVENIESNILLCIDDTSRKGLEVIGKQGGYYNRPSRYLDLENSFIPYFYYEGDLFIPSEEDISKELEIYVSKEVDSCLKDLQIYGFEIIPSKSKTKVTINKEDVNFEVDNSVIIKKDKRSMIFGTKDYPISQTSALKDILEVASYITNSHNIDPKMYCISCVEKMAREKDAYVKFAPISNNSLLVVISENRTSETSYIFSFLNKYTGNEESDDIKLTGENADSLPVSPENF